MWGGLFQCKVLYEKRQKGQESLTCFTLMVSTRILLAHWVDTVVVE